MPVTIKNLQTALHRVVDFLEINEAHKRELRDAIGDVDTTEKDAVEDKPEDTPAE